MEKMRMWNVNPKRMCNQHLLGEHVETHMFASCINNGISVQGYLDKGLLEIHNLRKRHDIIAEELKIRRMNHKSPLRSFKVIKIGKINSKENEKELNKRCKKCFK